MKIVPKKIIKACVPYGVLQIRNKIKESKMLDKMDYQIVGSGYVYTPWLYNKDFLEKYEIVKTHTLLGQQKAFFLWDLVSQTKCLSGALMEVGVWQGGSGALIASQAKMYGMNENVYLCDTFAGVVKAGENDTYYHGGEHADTSRSIVEHLLGEMELENVKLLQGIFPDDTGKDVVSETFRFCHIDVDVYESTKGIVDWIWPKLVKGGILLFDDYGAYTCDGVTKYINEQKMRDDCIVINNWNGQAIIVKTK